MRIAFVTQWFPPERQASLTGWIMASGGLGALAAAKPLELALTITGWRGIVLALAAATLAVAAKAIVIGFNVRADAQARPRQRHLEAVQQLGEILHGLRAPRSRRAGSPSPP